MKNYKKIKLIAVLGMIMAGNIIFAGCTSKDKDTITITNVSYDPTREMYEKYNEMFSQYYK